MSVLIAVTGGSGSGKSTLANTLLEGLRPDCAVLLSEDWYYRDIPKGPRFDAAAIDFDAIEARDHTLLENDLKRLKAGISIIAPQYCFVRHQREVDGRPISSRPVIIVEGAQILCVPALTALFDLKVYLETPDDIRFIRRLLRDQTERGRTLSAVVHQYLRTVRPAHLHLTSASRRHADLVVFDHSSKVEQPDPQALARMAEPAFCHAALAPYRRR